MALENPSESLPPPSTSLSDSLALSARINATSRATHLQLNRLITARLPLALPPCTTHPSLYITGLLHIAPIYITFESLWTALLDGELPSALISSVDTHTPDGPPIRSQSLPINPNRNGPPPVHRPEACARTQAVLAHLLVPGIQRSGRLRADLLALTDASSQELQEMLSAASQKPKLAAFLAHIRYSVNTMPHVLLAYAWVLYMALFSGGRYLRASLLSAGSDFWTKPFPSRPPLPAPARTTASILQSRHASHSEDHETGSPFPRRSSFSEATTSSLNPALQFFNFPGAQDGEDIKADFRARFAASEIQLTSSEKEDVVAEAQRIFSFMVDLVVELDGVCGTRDEDVPVLAKNLPRGGDGAAGLREGRERWEGMRSTRPGGWVDMMTASSGLMMAGLNRGLKKVQASAESVARPLRKRVSTADGVGQGGEAASGVRSVRKRLSMSDWDGVLFLGLTSMIPLLVLVMTVLAYGYIPV